MLDSNETTTNIKIEESLKLLDKINTKFIFQFSKDCLKKLKIMEELLNDNLYKKPML
jgi:hypothetical protein